VYLFAVESFTAFLYPDPAEVERYFQAGHLPNRLFDLIIVGATVLTIFGWVYLYMRAHGRSMQVPRFIEEIRVQLYVLFMNRLYVEQAYQRLGQLTMRALQRYDKRAQGWSQQ
jgi:NADH-quinone oxidoreductase subunit L